MQGAMSAADVNVRVLLALAVIVIVTQVAGGVIAKFHQPRVMGEILAGIMLGPSVLGVVWPQAVEYLFPHEVVAALTTFALVGVVLFMFLVGLELDLGELRGHAHRAVIISQVSIVAPMLLGGLFGVWLYPRFGNSVDRAGFILFVGVAMAITAFPVMARLLQETGLNRTRVGVLALTCAAVDDVTAWCVLAIVVALVQASEYTDVVQTLVLSLLFLAVMLKVVRPMLRRLVVVIPVALAMALALLGGWLTESIGIHAIFGSFMAGVVMPRHADVQQPIHDRIEPIVRFLLPVFFATVGLATRVDQLASWYLVSVTLAVIAVAVASKWGGALLAGRIVGETWRDASAIGVLMNTRGLTELVILRVGLELDVITTTLFTMMVLMALVTTLMAAPLLSIIKPSACSPKLLPPSSSNRVG
jgi:Kef-type K+ transport system membrane component KefB